MVYDIYNVGWVFTSIGKSKRWRDKAVTNLAPYMREELSDIRGNQ
jgi:hypothetical protein